MPSVYVSQFENKNKKNISTSELKSRARSPPRVISIEKSKKIQNGRFAPPSFKTIKTHNVSSQNIPFQNLREPSQQKRSSGKVSSVPQNSSRRGSPGRQTSSTGASSGRQKSSRKPPGISSPLPSIYHPYSQFPKFKSNNVLGNFQLNIKENNCQFKCYVSRHYAFSQKL